MKKPEHIVGKAVASTSAAGPRDFSGKWKNQLESEMVIVQSGTKITGKYTSKVSSGGSPTPPMDLVGFVNDDLISFSVSWPPKQAVTAWVGQMIEEAAGNPKIFTMWQMTVGIPDDDEDDGLWKTIAAGTDTFSRMP